MNDLQCIVDPISDMFIRIKNAQRAGHAVARFGYSKFKHEIAKTLERAHMVGRIERKGRRIKKVLEIELLTRDGTLAINEVNLFSKPSRRLYAPARTLQSSKKGGVMIISTSLGVMTAEEARKARVGGMLIAEVW